MQFNESLKRELVANNDEIDYDGSFTGTIHLPSNWEFSPNLKN